VGLEAQPMVDLMVKREQPDKEVSQGVKALMEVPLLEVIVKGPERVEILVLPKAGREEVALLDPVGMR
jgi:hypothetical protein